MTNSPDGCSAESWGRPLATIHEAEIERVALAIERQMFALHELPLDAELHRKYRATAVAALMAMPIPAPAQPTQDEYSFGTSYGKDLLTDINQVIHRGGTNALVQDCLQRTYREIMRLRKAIAAPVEGCPRPVIPDHSAKACVESGNCGCGASIINDAQSMGMREAVVEECRQAALAYAQEWEGKMPEASDAGHDIAARIADLASQPSPAATVEREQTYSIIETCRECGVSDPCGEDCPNYVEPKSPPSSSAASEGARLSNWLADYSHDLKEEGDFDQEAAQLDKASQWIAGHLNVQPQEVQVTDADVERAWAAMVGFDVAGMCFQASVVRGDIRTALESYALTRPVPGRGGQ